METRIRALAALSLAAITTLGGCFDTGEDSDTGTVGVSLVGHGASGAVYRLRDATITVSGASPTVVWNTEDDPDRTSLSADVNIGDYSAALAPGWRLERIVMSQPPVDVVAQLISPNPAAFTVEPMERTEVAFRFATDGTVVDMSQGYDIVIDVEEALPVFMVTSVSSVSLTEGGSAVVGLRLTAPPAANVTVTVQSSDPGAVAAVPTTLTFTPANWSLFQNVTVAGLQDADVINETVNVLFNSPGIPGVLVVVNVLDDDVQNIITSASTLTVNEGGNAAFSVRLSAQPAGPVSVNVVSSDVGALAVTPTMLTFTPANFNVPQTVVVAGIQDADNLDETVTVVLNGPATPTTTVGVLVVDDE